MSERADAPPLVAGFARTPFGRFGGALRDVDQRDLGAFAVRAALDRVGAPVPDQVVIGVNFPGSNRSIARQVALRAGLPPTMDAVTVDRACCSSLTAARLALAQLRNGDLGLAVVGGTENLSRVPFFLEDLRWGHRLGPVELQDQLVVTCPHSGVARAVQASDEAASFGIDRREQDEWAARSHELYWEAFDRGFFDEVVPVDDTVPGAQPLGADESPRRGVMPDRLAELPTVNGSSTVTAGNAPGLSTGASAVVLAAQRSVTELALPVQAEILGTGWAAGEPEAIGATPAVAAARALRAAGIDLGEIDRIEINEAFAAVPLVATDQLASGDRTDAERLRSKTNVNGGAVAIGHPTGASGARLLMTLVSGLRERGGGIGLAAICGGVAEAEAIVVRVDEGACS
ncbi:MAG: thiolase family protein [Ilumatobacter sp.]|uniref:thiolase family protein n=1 Tax=Ilumatobacter sp. TaxID=1967498 RepID=UPI00391C7F88